MILGDRDAAGSVKNLHLAVRKNRSGPTGAKIPFALRPVPLPGGDLSMCSRLACSDAKRRGQNWHVAQVAARASYGGLQRSGRSRQAYAALA